MDFFLSKVAISICALLIVAVLGTAMNQDRFIDGGEEIKSILEEFCQVAERAYVAGIEGMVISVVPELPNGDSITVFVEHRGISSHETGKTLAASPHCAIHTWRWDGMGLNQSTIETLDESSEGFAVSSGHGMIVETAYVLIENDVELMVFVLPQPG